MMCNGELLLALVLWIVAQIFRSFTVPVIITIAGIKLWGLVPRWIPVVFFVYAFWGVIASLLPYFVQMAIRNELQTNYIVMPASVVSGIIRILFAVACLRLAISVRKGLAAKEPSA